MKHKGNLIFDKWKASLPERDRTKAYWQGNFEDLFDGLFRAKIEFEQAHEILDKAIKAHYPTYAIARRVYKRVKQTGTSSTETEFIEDWQNQIAETAKRVFYDIYTIEGAPEEEEKYGSMSASEYRKQRKYAESHPLLDWTKIQLESAKADQVDVLDDINIDLGDL
jgi:hypothetical protein